MVARTVLFCVVVVTILMGCPTDMSEQGAISTYDGAISQAKIEGGNDRRLELRQCVRYWSDKASQRKDLFARLSHRSSNSTSPVVILEIGNAGFPRYDYVYIEGEAVTSSLHDQKTRSGTSDVGTFLEKLSAHDLNQLEGSASSNTDDGDCYFLTVSNGAAIKQAAVYADLSSSAAGILIRDLLSLVARE